MRRIYKHVVVTGAVAAALAFGVSGTARAQTGGGGGTGKGADSGAPAHDSPGTPSSTVHLAGLSNPDKVRREVEEAAKEAKIERQKRILKDSEKLMKLTAELKATVEAMTTDQLSPQTMKQLEQIEKLAADVKKQATAK